MAAKTHYPFSLKELARLVNEITSYGEGDAEIIRKRYERYAGNFSESVAFLDKLGLIKSRANTLSVQERLKQNDGIELFEQIIKDKILQSKKFPDVRSLLSKFEEREGRFEYAPPNSARFIESDVRNLLLKAGVVRYDRAKNVYFVEAADYIVAALSEASVRLSPLSPRNLEAAQAKRQMIGRAAEVVVLQEERRRLATNAHLVDQIKHVADEDVSVGFDIASFEGPVDETERFIEVKAVSPVDYIFNWSANEIEAAKRFKEHYHIYLVPVVGGQPTLEGLQIIDNPAELIVKSNYWEMTPSSYVVKRI